jgi:hypothetical protein
MGRILLEGDFAIAGSGEILISDYCLAGQDIGIDHVELPLGRLTGIACHRLFTTIVSLLV